MDNIPFLSIFPSQIHFRLSRFYYRNCLHAIKKFDGVL